MVKPILYSDSVKKFVTPDTLLKLFNNPAFANIANSQNVLDALNSPVIKGFGDPGAVVKLLDTQFAKVLKKLFAILWSGYFLFNFLQNLLNSEIIHKIMSSETMSVVLNSSSIREVIKMVNNT